MDEYISVETAILTSRSYAAKQLDASAADQQIIYHMLCYVLKCEVLSKTKDSGNNLPKLSNYHIKTLILWECEQKPQSWWSAESSFVKLCSSLLHKLSHLVTDKRFQQYFTTDCNLLQHFPEEASLTTCNSLQKFSRCIVSFELDCYELCRQMCAMLLDICIV